MISEYSTRQNTIRIRTSLVNEQMDLLKLTTDDLAEAIGVSIGAINHLLANGYCTPSALGKLAKVLGCSVWELVDGRLLHDH